MNSDYRSLTPTEKSALRRSVKEKCSLYDKELGCLRLNSKCQIFSVGFTDSTLCRYYEACILPSENEILAFLGRAGKSAQCPVCGFRFPVNRNQKYCSRKCAKHARRIRKREDVRRLRKRRAM